jgi:hypothetical protein
MAERPPKERVTVSIDPRNKEFLSQQHINASGLVDKLLHRVRKGEIKP